MDSVDYKSLGIIESRNLILSNKDIHISISEKHKSRFKACCIRGDRLERLLRNRTRIKTTWYCIYMVYVSIINTLLTINHSTLAHAVNVYMASWGNIKKINGESIGNKLFRITYIGRT